MHELGHGVVVELVVLDVLLLDDELEDEVELGVPSHAAVAICRSKVPLYAGAAGHEQPDSQVEE
jgi:hypothetical protein